MSYQLSAFELSELLNELPDEFRPNDVQQFIEDIEECNVPFSDIDWFITWYPELLHHIERACYGYLYFEIFEDWDAYLAEGYEYYEGDPYQPLDAIVVEDAGLSGVWYIMVY